MNQFIYNKAVSGEAVALFSSINAPDLYEVFYDPDSSKFERIYQRYLSEGKQSGFVSARKLIDLSNRQRVETRQYHYHPELMSAHTPFKQRILQSNLCMEIALHTHPYNNPFELNSTDGYTVDGDVIDGEIGLCTLAGVIVPNITSDEEYARVAYNALVVIDYCIAHSSYLFPHLEYTAKARRSAGVGILGMAQLIASKGLKYSSQEGRNFIHELAETHSWHLINASLRLGKELGNCTWAYKTKWADGWLPIDTYKKTIDPFITVERKRDWESLRKEIVANGGLRNTTLVAHMPGESSCVGSGITNGVYPIRSLYSVKGSGNTSVFFVVPHSEDYKYEMAYDIAHVDMVRAYAILQMHTDQAISADYYIDMSKGSVDADELFELVLNVYRFGLKTSYYMRSKLNSYDSSGSLVTPVSPAPLIIQEEEGCAGGACTL